MKKKISILLILIFSIIAVLGLYLMFSGPRMRVQPSIKSYQAQMPAPPANAVPFDKEASLPQGSNPLTLNQENTKIGKVAYSYYCSFCHGDEGLGNGPVGKSYIPRPANLQTSEIQKLSDIELYKAMLTGTGHEPVLAKIIDEQYRWYLVLYVRYLGSQKEE
jgi:mono/diheme cytochrome c family protein